MNKYICVSEELRTIIYFEKIDEKKPKTITCTLVKFGYKYMPHLVEQVTDFS